MICFDTNIFIYIANGTLDEDIIGYEPIIYASITVIESLGYPAIRSIEEQSIKVLLATLTEIPLSSAIIEFAVHLRQQKNMSLGDAIIAASAMENSAALWTANTDDFKHIEGLKLFNPL